MEQPRYNARFAAKRAAAHARKMLETFANAHAEKNILVEYTFKVVLRDGMIHRMEVDENQVIYEEITREQLDIAIAKTETWIETNVEANAMLGFHGTIGVTVFWKDGRAILLAKNVRSLMLTS